MGNIKGYQKRVIYLKNPGSSMFEEAYFVLSPKGESMGRLDSRDMVDEANRIIDESFKGSRRLRLKLLLYPALFILGALSGFLAMLIFK